MSLIAGDLLPLSLVDSPLFHSLMEAANDSYQVPSRKYLSSKMLPERSANLKQAVIVQLQNTSVVCVTVDLWTNRQLRSYFGITAHFIPNSDLCLKSAMLACCRFRGSHTADAIMEQFQKTTAEFGIISKLSFIVTDSASNMLKAFSLPGFDKVTEKTDSEEEEDSDDDSLDDGLVDDWNVKQFYDELSTICEHVPCFAHTIQLVIKDGFKEAGNITKVLSKVSTIVSYAKRSTTAADLLECEKKLKTANTTRWNSQLQMIRSVLRIPAQTLNALDTTHLSTYDRKILEDLIEILTPFETATHCVQGEKIVTSSMAVPCVRVLKETMLSLSQKYSSRFVAALQASVEKRLTRYENCDAFLIASALDPRFKLKWCTSSEVDSLKSNLIRKIKEANPSTDIQVNSQSECTPSSGVPSTSTGQKKQSLTFFDTLMNNSRAQAPCSVENVETIVEKYLSEPCLPQEENPLHFWKTHSEEYLCITKIVPRYLCIPASSAPIERIFSFAGKIFRPERCRLNDKTFETLMFLKCNQL